MFWFVQVAVRSKLDFADPADLKGGFGDQLFAGGLECRAQQWVPAGVVLLGHRELDLHEVLHPVTGDDHPLGDLGQVLLNGVSACDGADPATCAAALRPASTVEGVEVRG